MSARADYSRRIRPGIRRWLGHLPLAAFAAGFFVPATAPAQSSSGSPYPPQIGKILSTYCYDCHGDGMEKGKVAFDTFSSRDEILAKRDVFYNALKNVRAGIMPPEKKPRPSLEEQRALADWIKADVFQINVRNPDPGKVTLRRLNRVEYRNTIRDLTGFD
ncbi:MAG TPA: DUF1587 domain-containing protein, partial [Verrucomicrobiae bacterium]|nr:DUF1587 domain-containing protein [Verrucomicrobiae bacterium]